MNPILSRLLFIAAVAGTIAIGYSQGVLARTDLNTCGPNPIRCMSGYQPQCVSSDWQCVPNAASSSSSSDCGPSYVRCGTGYEPICTDDGRWQCQAAAPSSSDSSSCDSPSTILCARNTMPMCVAGEWTCVENRSSSSASSCPIAQILCITGTEPVCDGDQWRCVPHGSSSAASCEDATPIYCFQGAPICRDGTWHCPSTVGPLEIDRLSPSAGKVGSRVIISGQSFTRTGNTVYFGGSVLENVRSRQNGTKLVFRVPAKTTLPCLPFCKIAVLPYETGTYDVSVENRDGAVSNTVEFTITGKTSSSSSSSVATGDSCLCPAGQAWGSDGCTDEQMMCPMYYLEGGWCGCDGQVYGNSCVAAANGVKSGAPCNQ